HIMRQTTDRHHRRVQIYMAYINENYEVPKILVAIRERTVDASIEETVEKTRVRLAQLLKELMLLPKDSRELKVAITEMISRISGFIQRLPVSVSCQLTPHRQLTELRRISLR